MKEKDKRIKMMTELLRGIQIIKMAAWEESFMQKINAVRKKELTIMRKAAYITAFINTLSQCSAFLVTLYLY